MKSVNKIILFFVLCISSFTLLAQTKIKGKVTDGKEPIIGANITIKGTTEGTVSDLDGKFELSTNQATPLTLVISMVGMATSEVKFDGSQEEISVSMSEETSLLNDVVVAASRVEEKILESPVTIEKMDPKAIKTAAAADYYDDLAKLKGVQTINGSMTLTSVNTRGFGGISNTRFVQLMDGMDNAAPLLNFPTGNIVGIGELDINNVELVPGASSALYGPNAFNGILLMNSKNPFEQPGFSMQVKGGFAQANNGYGVKPLGSAALRVAHAFKSKKSGQDFAAIKANFSLFQGTDWYANDYTTDRIISGNPTDAPNFDGMNTYGDENRIFVPYAAVKPRLVAGASSSLQASPTFQAGVLAGVTAAVNQNLPAITAGVTAAVRQQAYNQAIAGGADEATANTMADAFVASPQGQATIAAGVQNQVQTLINQNYAAQLPVQANAYATSKIDSISPLLNLDLRRTGLSEDRLIDNHKAQSIKGDIGAYFRPFKDKSYEFSYNYRVGFGNSVYQGSERYALRRFTQQFHKVEIKGKDFFVRSYMSQTKDGDSYNMTALGAYTNEAFSPSQAQWVPTYLGNYANPLIFSALNNSAAATLQAANAQFLQTLHDTARARADRPWTSLTPEQQQAQIEAVRTGLFQRGGAGFIDNSRLFHTEAMLDLSRWTGKWIDIQVGGNHRLYSLSTQGTVFNEDPNGTGTYNRIKIKEYGAFLQLQRKLFKDHLRLQASVRIDKNQNFKMIVSPRVAVVGTFGKNREHNIRASYQTGFRNPDSQAQYIYFPTTNILLGGTRENAERYGIYNGGAYSQASYNAFVASQLAGAPDSSLLVTANFDYVKPEQLQVVELGYKAVLFKKLMIDVNGYFNIYKDFISQLSVVNKDTTFHKGLPILPGSSWRPYTNLADKAFSYGAGIGITYMLPKGINVRGSYNYMDFKLKNANNSTATERDLGFNASKHQMVVGIGGDRVWKGLGFSVDYRWQSAIDWSSDFADGTVKARGMLDASLSYFVEKAMTTFKIGATNIAGPTYRTNVGGPFIGRTFFAAITFDQNKLWKEHHNEVTGAKEF
ncbi:MAG: carboxypeptidase-like regulatory domain-containing protein [Chitinophagales bacterium]